ncbi:MAG: polyprenol monophosphomannose synthase [Chlorobi bacterium]|nr:polyprenol monophosphomannose synthase [Chlorobiota bacterium]
MASSRVVVIPTYNEAENITDIIRAVMELPRPFDVLVVDDNSPDGTGKLVEEAARRYPGRVHLLARPGKEGLGKAYIAGFREALARGYEYIFEMDADFSHNPADLPRLADVLEKEGCDVAIGSRYITGVNVVDWPLSRVLLSYFASWYVRLVTRMRIHDTTAGFVGYRRKVLESVNFDDIQFTGYGFQIEMKYRAWKKGFCIKEIPIIFINRQKGESKLHGGIITEGMWGVLKLRWKSLIGKL